MHKHVYMHVHSCIVMGAEEVEATQCPSAGGEGISQRRRDPTQEYYSAVKRDEVWAQATTGVNSGNTTSISPVTKACIS